MTITRPSARSPELPPERDEPWLHSILGLIGIVIAVVALVYVASRVAG